MSSRSRSPRRRTAASTGQPPDHDPLEFATNPHTLAVLVITMLVMTYFVWAETNASHNTADNMFRGVFAAIGVFLVFSAIHMKDGLFRRPHVVFWRLVMGVNVLYLMLIVFLLFQDLDDARKWLALVDPKLGKPLEERAYAAACEITTQNVWSVIKDEFFVAHFIGWFLKSLFLRDEMLCWVLSILFEIWEYTFEHMLPNFAECWWDHLILDVLVTNWLGIYLGMKTSRWLQQKEYDWAGVRNKPERVAMQILPKVYMPYQWEIFSSWKRLAQVGYLLLIQSLIELNYFWLKFFLWIPPPHNIIVPRLFMWGLIGAAAIREYYDFITSSTKKFGTMAWLCTITVSAETLLVIKYGISYPWPNPTPNIVIWGWGIAATLVLGGAFVWYGRIRPAHEKAA